MGKATRHASSRTTTTMLGAGALALGTLALAGQPQPRPARFPGPRRRELPVRQRRPNGRISELVKCGGTMFAVGSFTAISWNGRTYNRH